MRISHAVHLEQFYESFMFGVVLDHILNRAVKKLYFVTPPFSPETKWILHVVILREVLQVELRNLSFSFCMMNEIKLCS